ncbi:MAG: S41 family peptidase [Nannocystaceae bacterium]
MTRRSPTLLRPALAAALALGLACDPEDGRDEPASARAEADPAPAASLARAAAPSTAAGKQKEEHGEELLTSRTMPGAKAGFERVLALVEESYVDDKVDLDYLYTGAIEGVLARLIQLKGHPVNTLLGPEELAELVHGTKGTIVGVGVMIEHVADVVVIRDVIPGGPAQKAGLRRGDRILGIDGARVQEMGLPEVVARIRGEAGTEVGLFVQRDTEEWTEKLRRDTVQIQNVEARLVGDGVGYLRLRGFAETTAEELDAAIQGLQKEGMTRLVIDLRSCPGGLLDAAIAVTGRFLGKDEVIMTMIDRKKGETTLRAEVDGPWRSLPLAVLIGPYTASSAEIFADAIATHKRGTLVGQETMGKGSIESVLDLEGGWAIKLSTGRFQGASGEPRMGKGVRPTLPLVAEASDKHTPIAEVDPANDPVLELAVSWLGDRP